MKLTALGRVKRELIWDEESGEGFSVFFKVPTKALFGRYLGLLNPTKDDRLGEIQAKLEEIVAGEKKEGQAAQALTAVMAVLNRQAADEANLKLSDFARAHAVEHWVGVEGLEGEDGENGEALKWSEEVKAALLAGPDGDGNAELERKLAGEFLNYLANQPRFKRKN